VEYCGASLLVAGYVYHAGGLIAKNCPANIMPKKMPKNTKVFLDI